MSGGKNKGPKVYDYLLTLHAGWCHGPVDSFNQLWIKEKRIFCGALRERRNICVDLPEVFGGDEKEGGVVGVVEYYPGTVDQICSDEMAARVGLTPQTMPGYRGLTHTFFRGTRSLDQGFQWATNNPYMPPFKAHLTRIPKQLNIEHAVVWPLGDDEGTIGAGGNWQLPVEPTGEQLRYAYEEAFPWNPFSTEYGTGRFYPVGRPPNTFCDEAQGSEASTQVGFLGGPKVDFSEDGWVIPPQLSTALPTTLDIDSGAVTAEADFSVNYSGFGAGQQVGVRIRAIAGVTDPVTGEMTPGVILASVSQNVNSPGASGTMTVSASLQLPAGTRFVEVGGLVNQLTIGETHSAAGRFVRLRWERVELGYCGFKPKDEDAEEDEDPEPDNSGLAKMPDANPAHMIYECMTNDDWGKGEDPSFIDTASFLSAAEVLFNERFGLSLGWFQQDTIEAFIQEVLDHIKAFLFKDPATGLWTLKLLRGDYDANTLPWLNPDNCKVNNPKRKQWGETVNEIVVTYTDPTNEEESTVSSHNLANIAVQGRILSENRNYYGVRNERLAQRLADREVLESGTPLWSGQIEVDRREWAIRPGDCRRLFWPEEGIESMVVRVMSIDYGTPKDRKITLNVVEDIFGMDVLAFTSPQGTLHRDPRPDPQPVSGAMVFAPPLPEILRIANEEDQINDDRFPEVPVILAIPQVSNRSIIDVEVRAPVAQPDGQTLAEVVATVDPVNTVLLPYRLPAEDQSLLPRDTILSLGRGLLVPGSLLMLGSDPNTHEIIRLISYDAETRYWTVQRAVYDTAPKAWNAGTRLWVMPDESSLDASTRMAGSTYTYWFMPRTVRGRLSPQRAPAFVTPLRPRPYLPFRPANVRVNGRRFVPWVFDDPTAIPASLTVEWSNRNRFSEDAEPLGWLATSVAAEDGQTTTVRLRRADGTILEEVTGLTGTSTTIPLTGLGAEFPDGYVEVVSVRGGLESWEGYRFPITVRSIGWDFGWNFAWDGVFVEPGSVPPVEPADPARIDTAYVPGGYTLSEGNIRFQNTIAGTNYLQWLLAADRILPENGVHYWEVEVTRTSGGVANGYIGVMREDLALARYNVGQNPIFEGAVAYRGNGELWSFDRAIQDARVYLSGLPTYGNADILMFAFDAARGWLWVGRNGVWANHPDFSRPTFVLPFTQVNRPYRITLQGRANGDGGRLRGTFGTVNYPVPTTCRPLRIA